jgi:hypothetical protein
MKGLQLRSYALAEVEVGGDVVAGLTRAFLVAH